MQVMRMRVCGAAVRKAHEMAQELTQREYALAGGYFSDVYVGELSAAKVIDLAGQDGYVAWLKAVRPLMGRNPHVPRVFRVITLVGDDGCESVVIHMEKLQPSDSRGTTFCEHEFRTLRWAPSTHEWAEVMSALNGLAEDWQLDMHGGNVMMRGNDIVITDPVSFPKL